MLRGYHEAVGILDHLCQTTVSLLYDGVSDCLSLCPAKEQTLSSFQDHVLRLLCAREAFVVAGNLPGRPHFAIAGHRRKQIHGIPAQPRLPQLRHGVLLLQESDNDGLSHPASRVWLLIYDGPKALLAAESLREERCLAYQPGE